MGAPGRVVFALKTVCWKGCLKIQLGGMALKVGNGYRKELPTYYVVGPRPSTVEGSNKTR